MKYLVKLIQFAIIIAVVYPVYYVWDTDRIDNFCELVTPGLSLSTLKSLAEENNVSLNTPVDLHGGGQWMTSVESSASIDGYACVIKGAENRIATAKIIKAD